MIRLSLLMAGLLMASALSLVTARYQSRLLYVQADKLDDQARELDIQWRRLQLQRAELARNARTDAIARKDLGMQPRRPADTWYVRGGPATGAPVAGTAGGGTQQEGRP